MWNETLSSKQFLCTYRTRRDYNSCISWVLDCETLSSATLLHGLLIFHPRHKLHDSMAPWKSWRTAGSKILINTVLCRSLSFFFFFEPTNNKLNFVSCHLSCVSPPSAAESGDTDMWNLIPAPDLHAVSIYKRSEAKKKIQNEAQAAHESK